MNQTVLLAFDFLMTHKAFCSAVATTVGLALHGNYAEAIAGLATVFASLASKDASAAAMAARSAARCRCR